MGRSLHVCAAALAASAALAPAALARTADDGRGAAARAAQAARPSPWATVNVCDTAGFPDGVGVRGAMPVQGGSDVRHELRIRLQYRRGVEWLSVKGADSGWVLAGTGGGERRAVEAGQTFTVTPPRAGGAYVLRGLVSFRWREAGGTVVRAERRATHSGHPGTAGADPDSYSAATCTVR